MPDPALISTAGLRLDISTEEESIVVRCSGTLMYESSDFLKREVRSRIPDKGRMVLDLSDVSRMDSSGLGAVVACYLSARNRSCDFRLINLNKQIRDLLSLSNLLSVFEICGQQSLRMP